LERESTDTAKANQLTGKQLTQEKGETTAQQRITQQLQQQLDNNNNSASATTSKSRLGSSKINIIISKHIAPIEATESRNLTRYEDKHIRRQK
jgi:hypothetical protein